MINVSNSFSCSIRVKRGRDRLNLIEAAALIGVSAKTLSLIEKGEKNKIKKTVYEKIVNWLLEESEV